MRRTDDNGLTCRKGRVDEIKTRKFSAGGSIMKASRGPLLRGVTGRWGQRTGPWGERKNKSFRCPKLAR